MKAKTFENLIRKVVREEIDYSLRREIKSLKEDLRDEFKPTIVEHTEKMVKVPTKPKTSLKEKIMGTNPIINKKVREPSKPASANGPKYSLWAFPLSPPLVLIIVSSLECWKGA